MSLPEDRRISLSEFYRYREDSDQLLEYIDGMVFMTPSPSTKHQRISGRLHAQLFQLLDGSGCEVFQAPFDVELKSDHMEGTRIVIPDLSIICDKTGFQENRYVGVPSLIIEIISPSNQSHDLVFKLNLYMQFGVKEYWIVNPLINTIQVYVLDEKKTFKLHDVAKDKGIIRSAFLKEFNVDVEKIFA
ncbi:Uma2 family endonuclease [Mesobacillus sp. AQ2]|uniref:Uma2 family endonuclease n=1 Tax=Bacillaceae TaxID=186817 RepID=UPI0011A9E456|nr:MULTISPECIES: Uma2 family endonuclease [Bacillaceae]WHX41107.1 Uma2 family endonuclease [Mesobacillus sp. AQ2]